MLLYYIPEKVMELFKDEFNYREMANWQELTNFTVALFIGKAKGPATVPACGGTSLTNNGLMSREDEDDLRGSLVAPKLLLNDSTSKLNRDYVDKLRNNQNESFIWHLSN